MGQIAHIAAVPILFRQVILPNRAVETIAPAAVVGNFDSHVPADLALHARAPSLHARMHAIRILGLEARAERRVDTKRAAECVVVARPSGPHGKRIQHRRHAGLRVAQQPGLTEIHTRHVDRRRAVSALVGREVRGTQHVVVQAVAALKHGALVDRPGAGDARHPHRLSAPAQARLARIAGVDGSAAHVEGARCKLRNRAPGIRRLGQLRDRDVHIRVEAGEHLVILLTEAGLVLVPETEVQRDVFRHAPRVLEEGAKPVIRDERARCHLGLHAGGNAEHESRPAQPEIRGGRFDCVVGFTRVSVIKGEVARRISGEVAKALVPPEIRACAQRVGTTDLRHIQLALVVSALVERSGVVTQDLVEVAIEIVSPEVDSRQLAGSHAAEVTAGLAELIHVSGQPDSARRELLQTEALIRLEEAVGAELTVDHRVTGDASPGAGAGPRLSHPR